ncbi:hypothetical protein MPSEU_000909500 [Mayamaea pseudoterrestris]|nr:hypothetical protein MPSEU_000909500 [Mayamaea pseudoterrestris]
MIIEILESSEEDTLDVGAAVGTILDRIVEHYRQPIHQQLQSQQPQQELRDNDNDEIPPILAFHASELQRLQEDFEVDNILILQCLLCNYKERIRSFSLDATASAVLIHYEWLVSYIYLQDADMEIKAASNSDTRLDAEALDEALVALAQDITLATANEKHLTSLISLLRLLQMTLDLASHDTRIVLEQSTLCLVASTCLSFNMFDDEELYAAANERLYNLHPYTSITMAPFAFNDKHNISLEPLPPLQLGPFAWNTMEANDIVDKIWWSKYWDKHISHRHAATADESLRLVERKHTILQYLTVDAMSKATRSHFFGHDMLAPVANSQTQLFLGKVGLMRPNDDSNNKPYLVVPSRVPSALQYLSLLQLDAKLTESIWDNFAPILYELLAALDEKVNGLAALAVFRLLQHVDKHLILQTSPISNNLLLALDRVVQTCRNGSVLVLVGLAQTELLRLEPTNVDGRQRMEQRLHFAKSWLLVLETYRHRSNEKDLIVSILLTLIPLLHMLGNGSHTSQRFEEAIDLGRPLLRALLPLLELDFGDAWMVQADDNVEASSRDYRIQMAALVALLNSMIITYPIVCRHAGKVLSSCLALACRVKVLASKANDLHDKHFSLHSFLELAVHVAAVALVLTAEKGQQIFAEIESSSSKYDAVVLEMVGCIQREAIRQANFGGSVTDSE